MALRALWDVTQQFQNKNGSNLTSGKIYIYYQGRTALATTYHDEDGTVVNSNPVLLDNNGRATAFADPIYSYTIVVCDYYGKELFSQDITLHDAISTAEDVVILGSNGTVLVDRTELPNGVQCDLSVNTDIIATKEDVSDLEDEINDKLDDIESELADKKDKQTALTFDGAATKTVKKITQNANGEMNVEFEDIDLPPEVPNVEITSEDNSVQVTETTDVQTNTKTFDLSVNVDDALEYGQFRATNVTSQAQLNKIKGNLELNNYSIKLKKGNSYHFTVRGSYVATSAANTATTISYIEYSSFTPIQVNVDNTITDPQYFEISYDIYNLSRDTNYIVAFSSMSSGKVSELWVEVHNLNGVSINGSGGGGEGNGIVYITPTTTQSEVAAIVSSGKLPVMQEVAGQGYNYFYPSWIGSGLTFVHIGRYGVVVKMWDKQVGGWTDVAGYDTTLSSESKNAVQNATLYAVIGNVETLLAAL